MGGSRRGAARPQTGGSPHGQGTGTPGAGLSAQTPSTCPLSPESGHASPTPRPPRTPQTRLMSPPGVPTSPGCPPAGAADPGARSVPSGLAQRRAAESLHSRTRELPGTRTRARGARGRGGVEAGYLRVEVAHRVVLDLLEHLLGDAGHLARHGRGGPEAPQPRLPPGPAGPAPQQRGRRAAPALALQVGPSAPPPSAPLERGSSARPVGRTIPPAVEGEPRAGGRSAGAAQSPPPRPRGRKALSAEGRPPRSARRGAAAAPGELGGRGETRPPRRGCSGPAPGRTAARRALPSVRAAARAAHARAGGRGPGKRSAAGGRPAGT